MPLNGHYALCYIIIFWSPTQKLNEDRPPPKCSPETPVSGSIMFMCIFTAIGWRRDNNYDFYFFWSLYLLNVHRWGHNYCTVICGPSLAFHWHRNRWPGVILNGHFVLNSVYQCYDFCLHVLSFVRNCLEMNRATHLRSAAKMYPGDSIRFWQCKVRVVIHWGSLETEHQIKVPCFILSYSDTFSAIVSASVGINKSYKCVR